MGVMTWAGGSVSACSVLGTRGTRARSRPKDLKIRVISPPMAPGAGVWARGAVVSEETMAHGRVQAREGWSLTLNSLELVSSDVDTTLLSRFWPPPPPTIGLGPAGKAGIKRLPTRRSNQKGTMRTHILPLITL